MTDKENEENLDILQLSNQLPDLADGDLVEMLNDIEFDPERFSKHVGIDQAVVFFSCLLQELKDRGLVDLEDPKGLHLSTLKSFLLAQSQGLPPKPAEASYGPLGDGKLPALKDLDGNRKQRRARLAQIKAARKTLSR